jgi:hypothetical protein
MGFECLLQRQIGNARLNPRNAIGRINLNDPVHSFEGEYDTATVRHGRTSGAGSLAPCDQIDPLIMAELYNLLNLIMGGSENYCVGQGVPTAVIVTIGPAIPRLSQYGRFADNSG